MTQAHASINLTTELVVSPISLHFLLPYARMKNEEPRCNDNAFLCEDVVLRLPFDYHMRVGR